MGDLNNILREARASEGVRQLQAEFMAALEAASPAEPVRTYAVASDFSELATRVSLILSAAEACANAIVKQAAALAPGDIDKADMLSTIKAVFHDLNGDMTGPLIAKAQDMAAKQYDGCKPGPFFKHRSVW